MTHVRTALLAAATVSAVALTGCTSTSTPTSAGAAAPAPTVSVSVSASAPTVTATTRAALVAHLPDVAAADGDGFDVFSARTDPAGDNHVRYTRTYHGLPVYGGDVIVHTGVNGAYLGVSNGLVQPMRMSTAPALSGIAALTAARAEFKGFVTGTGGPKLVVDAMDGVGQLAWDSLVIGTARDGRTPSRLHVITDARSGAVLRTWDEIETITGTGKSLDSGTVALDTTKAGPVYRLVDSTRGGSTCDLGHRTEGICPVYTDRDDIWGNGNTSDGATVAVDAQYGAAMTFDYFKKVLGRNGIRGDGKGVTSRVHVDDQMDNAFWDRQQLTMNYGDGDGNVHPFVELDVAGHEMTHGITQFSVSGGLQGDGETSGLDEGTSDIFGTMVEFYAANPNDPPDYTIGEKIFPTPIRVMYDPPLDGKTPGCYTSAIKTAADPHFGAGVVDHFFFDLAEGTGKTPFGTSPVCGGAPAVKGIGRDKAAKIWYRALDVYFTTTTGYVNAQNPSNTARAYSLHAAADLYGRCGTEYKAVRAAWTAVGVAGNDPAC